MSYLFTNANILTIQNGKFKYLKNAYLGTEGSVIDYIGTVKPERKYDCEKNMYNRMLIPGLVNAHGHAAMTLLRGIGSNLPLSDWLHVIWPIEDSLKDEDFINGMNMALLEMIACGTTSFSDMYFRPFTTMKCVQASGINANLTRVFMGGDDSTDYKTFINRTEALQLFGEYDGICDGRIKIDFSVHAEYTVNHRLAAGFAEEIACIPGARLQLHLSETEKEHAECIQRYGMTPAQWFESLGFFNIPGYAAHCVHVSENDIDILKKHNISIVHNPSSNMKLGSGFAPVPHFIDKGVNVALGTDGCASNNNLNMFEEMHLASVIHNGYLKDSVALKAEDVFRMATVNGATAQGREDCGSLEVGKKADIVAVNLDAVHMQPVFDPVALLCYSAQGSDVTMTMANGKILYENGQYLTLDKDRIFSEFNKSISAIGKNLNRK